MKEERQIQTINIFMSRTKFDAEDAATVRQINLLKKLCTQRDIDIPFTSTQDAKNHLKKKEVSRALKELLEKGNTISFIYPYVGKSSEIITFFD